MPASVLREILMSRLMRPWAPLVSAALMALQPIVSPPVPFVAVIVLILIVLSAGHMSAVWSRGPTARLNALKLIVAISIVMILLTLMSSR